MATASERRRYARLKKQRERDIKREENKGKRKAIIAGAAAVGIGYVAYRNKDAILDHVQGFLAKNTVRLNRVTENKWFRGKIEETRNLNRAVTDTYGSGDIRDVMSRMADREGTAKRLRNRISDLNEGMDERLARSVPKDVATSLSQMAGMDNENNAKAFNAAMMENLEKVLDSEDYKDAVGNKKEAIKRLFQEHPEALKRKHDVKSGDMPLGLVRAFSQHNNDPDSLINFGITDKEQQADFLKTLTGVAKETQETTKSQWDDYVKAQAHKLEDISEGNTYAKYKNLYDIMTLEGVRQKHTDDSTSFLADGLKKQGYREATMADAEQFVERINGKMFLRKEKSDSAEAFERVFAGSKEHGLATKYLKAGERLGLDADELRGTRYSKHIHINDKTGEVISSAAADELFTSGVDFLQNNFELPMVHVNPLDWLNRRKKAQEAATPGAAVYEKGWVSSFTQDGLFAVDADINTRNLDSKGVLAKQYLHIGDTIYDGDIVQHMTGEDAAADYAIFRNKLKDHAVDTGYDIKDTSSGVWRRYAETLSGRTHLNKADLNQVQDLLKLNQEDESYWDRLSRMLNKDTNPLSAQNLLEDSLNTVNPSGHIDHLVYTLEGTTRGLSPKGEDALHASIVDVINSTAEKFDFKTSDLKTEDGLLRLAEAIADESKYDKEGTISAMVKKDLEASITSVYNWNKETPEELLKRDGFMRDINQMKTNLQQAAFNEGDLTISGQEMLKKQIEQYGLGLMMDKQMDVQSIVADSGVEGATRILDEVEDLNSLNLAKFFQREYKRADDLDAFQKTTVIWRQSLTENADIASSFQHSLDRAEPLLSAGVSPKRERLLDQTEYMPVKHYQGPLKALNEAYKEMGDIPELDGRFDEAAHLAQAMFDWGKETGGGIFQGEGGQVTSAHAGTWNVADNLDKRLQKWGLGLPNEKKGSVASIMGNQYFYRIAVPYIGYQYAKYVDDMTGGRISKTLANTYANMSMDVADKKEKLGINSTFRTANELMPYLEHAKEWAPVKLANAATLGALTNDQSPDELREYYRSGEDAIRKGRYWGIISGTPWMGGRTDYYRPNLYRRIHSDWQYTDTKFGSRSEYWANHWLPTPTNPLAPLKRYVFDPYHYEDKHEDRRPYAMTGGFEEIRSIPLVGPLADRAFSSVVKPARKHPRLEKAHEAYLRQENERVATTYLNMNSGGTVTKQPGGGLKLNPDLVQADITNEDGLLDEEALNADSVRFSNERQSMGQGQASAGEQTPGISDKPSVAGRVRGELTKVNQVITAEQDPIPNARPSQAGTIYKPTTVTNLTNAVDPNAIRDPKGVWEEMYFNAGGFAGLRGFVSRMALGYRPNDTRTQYLQTSDRFNDFSRQFWQSGAGGFGGDLSEIFRRYIQNPQRNDHYNPIRNTQPSWMPGQEYFTDFKHGDPYVKIPYGEIRLPGSAYESIYSVRTDAEGNYSAFDRYRILADVAPYSDQYRLAKKEVSLLNQANMLTEQQQTERKVIEDQVAEKRDTRHMYDKRYSNALVNRETVTITRVLDQNTFLTKEYGNQAMKLAGVSVRQDDTASNAIINEVLQAGKKVDIEIDADPKNRVRDDVVESMRVVVYSKNMNPFGPMPSGSNLNYQLSKQPGMTIRDDKTAVATRALTADGHITIGKMMETVMHDMVPNVPVVNIFADKFMPVRTPLEQYRKELYSKSFRNWANPIDEWVRPMLESGASRSPLTATLHGAGLGALFHRKKATNSRLMTAGAVGTAFGVMAGIRTLYDASQELFGDGERWVPERRREEREIDEYFDKLKYVKYKGLYERAADIAKKKEGTDVRGYLSDAEQYGRQNKGLESYLKERKKWLTIERDKRNHEGARAMMQEEITNINEQLKEMSVQRENLNVGPYTALALRYKDEFESTLTASAVSGDVQKIFRALPKKDKEFFTRFQTASPKERTEILKLVPKNQRNMYRQQFGLAFDEDDDESIEDYFTRYDLPDRDWEGWEPETNLDNIKIKVMQEKGLDTTESNFWDTDLMRAENSGAKPIPIEATESEGFISRMLDRLTLKEALEGVGLKNVNIQMEVSAADNFQFVSQVNIQREREQEIESGVKEYMQAQYMEHS